MSTTTTDTYIRTCPLCASEPVVAGRLEPRGPVQTFVYARSYRERPGAIPLYLPELPFRAGRLEPAAAADERRQEEGELQQASHRFPGACHSARTDASGRSWRRPVAP
jgi:hypothetical protein